MRLRWEDDGNGSYFAKDEATGLEVWVEKFDDNDPAKPFSWCVEVPPCPPCHFGWPVYSADTYEGDSETAEEAMAAAEAALPSAEELRRLRLECAVAWEVYNKKQAAPNN